MAYMVSYFIVRSKRNEGIAVVFGVWPVRVLRQRGWTHKIAQRVATAEESQKINASMRCQAILYRSIDDLLEDERRVLDDAVYKRLEESIRLYLPHI